MELPIAAVYDMVSQVVRTGMQEPSKPVDELLVAAARERGLDPADCACVSYRFNFYRGGTYANWELMTRAACERFSRQIIDTDVYINFGEINGKHSQVIRSWSQVDKTNVICGWRSNEEAASVAMVLMAHGKEHIDCGRLFGFVDADDSDDDSDDDSNAKRPSTRTLKCQMQSALLTVRLKSVRRELIHIFLS